MMKKTILLVLAMCLAVSVGAVETFVSSWAEALP